MDLLRRCVLLLLVANSTAETNLVVNGSCHVSLQGEDNMVMVFPVRPEITASTAPLFAYVKREGETTDVANCERELSASEIKCSVINSQVQSAVIVEGSLTLVFPSLTQDLQGVYTLDVHFNNSWEALQCTLTVKDAIAADEDTKDHTIAIATGVVVLILLCFLLVALCWKRDKIRSFFAEKQITMESLPQKPDDPQETAEQIMMDMKNSSDCKTTEHSDIYAKNEGVTDSLLTTETESEPQEMTADKQVQNSTEPLLQEKSECCTEENTTENPSETNRSPSLTSKQEEDPLEEMKNKPWYHDSMTREEAEKVLRSPQNGHGSFLIRPSHTSFGIYVLTVRFDTLYSSGIKPRIRRRLITWNGERSYFIIPVARNLDKSFTTLSELVDHYSRNAEDLEGGLLHPYRME